MIGLSIIILASTFSGVVLGYLVARPVFWAIQRYRRDRALKEWREARGITSR